MTPNEAKSTPVPFYANHKKGVIRVYDWDKMMHTRASAATLDNKRHFMVDTNEIEKITPEKNPEYFL